MRNMKRLAAVLMAAALTVSNFATGQMTGVANAAEAVASSSEITRMNNVSSDILHEELVVTGSASDINLEVTPTSGEGVNLVTTKAVITGDYTLQFVSKDAGSEDRGQDGYWIGMKVTNPKGDKGLSYTQSDKPKCAVGSKSANKDLTEIEDTDWFDSTTKDELGLWFGVNQKMIDEAKAREGALKDIIQYTYKFDWDANNEIDQILTIQIPVDGIELESPKAHKCEHVIGGLLNSRTGGLYIPDADSVVSKDGAVVPHTYNKYCDVCGQLLKGYKGNNKGGLTSEYSLEGKVITPANVNSMADSKKEKVTVTTGAVTVTKDAEKDGYYLSGITVQHGLAYSPKLASDNNETYIRSLFNTNSSVKRLYNSAKYTGLDGKEYNFAEKASKTTRAVTLEAVRVNPSDFGPDGTITKTWTFDWLGDGSDTQVVELIIEAENITYDDAMDWTDLEEVQNVKEAIANYNSQTVAKKTVTRAGASAADEAPVVYESTVSYNAVDVKWVAKDAGGIERPVDGHWVGMLVELPKQYDVNPDRDKIKVQIYSNSTQKWGDAYNFMDEAVTGDSTYIDLWGLLTYEKITKAKQAGTPIEYKLRVDWNGDGKYDQIAILQANPNSITLSGGVAHTHDYSILDVKSQALVSAAASEVEYYKTCADCLEVATQAGAEGENIFVLKGEVSNAMETSTAKIVEQGKGKTDIVSYDAVQLSWAKEGDDEGYYVEIKVAPNETWIQNSGAYYWFCSGATFSGTSSGSFNEEMRKGYDPETGKYAAILRTKINPADVKTKAAAGELLELTWEFDWTNNGNPDQTVKISINPKGVTYEKPSAKKADHKDATWVNVSKDVCALKCDLYYTAVTNTGVDVYVLTQKHDLKDWENTIAATCGTGGAQVQKCKNCNAVINTRETTATGHTFTRLVPSASTKVKKVEEYVTFVAVEVPEHEKDTVVDNMGNEKEVPCTHKVVSPDAVIATREAVVPYEYYKTCANGCGTVSTDLKDTFTFKGEPSNPMTKDAFVEIADVDTLKLNKVEAVWMSAEENGTSEEGYFVKIAVAPNADWKKAAGGYEFVGTAKYGEDSSAMNTSYAETWDATGESLTLLVPIPTNYQNQNKIEKTWYFNWDNSGVNTAAVDQTVKVEIDTKGLTFGAPSTNVADHTCDAKNGEWVEIAGTDTHALQCSVYNAFAGKVFNIETKAHEWSEWEAVVQATCGATGSSVKACSVCAVEESREDEQKPHSYTKLVASEETKVKEVILVQPASGSVAAVTREVVVPYTYYKTCANGCDEFTKLRTFVLKGTVTNNWTDDEFVEAGNGVDLSADVVTMSSVEAKWMTKKEAGDEGYYIEVQIEPNKTWLNEDLVDGKVTYGLVDDAKYGVKGDVTQSFGPAITAGKGKVTLRAKIEPSAVRTAKAVTGDTLAYEWEFDWNADDTVDQTVKVVVDPNGVAFGPVSTKKADHTCTSNWVKIDDDECGLTCSVYEDAVTQTAAVVSGEAVYVTKAAHKFGKWTETTAATCGGKGTQERTCENCGYKQVDKDSLTQKDHEYTQCIVSDATAVKVKHETPIVVEKPVEVTYVAVEEDVYGNEVEYVATRTEIVTESAIETTWETLPNQYYKTCANGCGNASNKAEDIFYVKGDVTNKMTTGEYVEKDNTLKYDELVLDWKADKKAKTEGYYVSFGFDADKTLFAKDGSFAFANTDVKVVAADKDAVKTVNVEVVTGSITVDVEFDPAYLKQKAASGATVNATISVDWDKNDTVDQTLKLAIKADGVTYGAPSTKAEDHVCGLADSEWVCIDEATCGHLCSVYEAVKAADAAPVYVGAKTHNASEWTVVTAPACTVEGAKTGVCADCSGAAIVPVEPTGHNIVTVAAVNATCTKPGNKEHYKCTTCNKLFEDAAGTKETDAKGVETTKPHTLVKTDAKTATCTVGGNPEYWKCSSCGKLFEDSEGTKETTIAKLKEKAPALGHKIVEVEARPATCTQDGVTAHWACINGCGKLYSDAEGKNVTSLANVTVKATGHITELQGAKEPTETEEGYTGDEVCTVCGEIVKVGEVIPVKSSEPIKSPEPSPSPSPIPSPSQSPSPIPESPSPDPSPSPSPVPVYTKGDVDANTKIELNDAQMTLRASLHLLTLTDTQKLAADVDENGEVKLADAQQILRYALHLITEFKVVQK